MSLRLLVDECLLHKLFVDALIAAGHDVQTVAQLNLISSPDNAVFNKAVAEDRIVITSNCADFMDLANAHSMAGKNYPGILLVFLYNNVSKDMSVPEIVKAIANFEATGAPIANTTVSLASYRY